MLRDYLEITRLFNMGLTAVAPVLGALSMWDIGSLSLPELCILFIIGSLAHIYGFVINDVIDIKVDKLSKELSARPLVRGSITRRRAAFFAISCMVGSFLLSLIFFSEFFDYISLFFILLIAYFFATIYDVASKKYPGMDLFVTGAIFFLILFGARTIGTPTMLAYIVALIGSLQVLFMNMINGAIKDIDHDKQGSADTIAIRLGANIHAGVIRLPVSFRTTGYLIEIIRIILIFLPFVLLDLDPYLWQIVLLVLLALLTFFSIYKLYCIKTFNRPRIRKMIGIIVIFMYATTPIMLSSLNIYIILVALIPPLWFFVSNLVLHKTIFEPKTM
ncbi:MAG: UbiA prenyltransferase family protein [Candidatus Thermoplasmatota archaeon]|nr:UbiA prenyltransferase family protein [Candidatus Thermoplasmatota archaeon]